MKLRDVKNKLLKNPKFKAEYFTQDLGLEISEMLIKARLIKGLTQKELAEKAGVQQPSIARIESGHIPTLAFLQKIAHALGTELLPPSFAFMNEQKNNASNKLKAASFRTKIKQIS